VPPELQNRSSVFSTLGRNEVLRDVMTDMANALRDEGELDVSGTSPLNSHDQS
jgi:hypothetical protein